MDSGGSQAIRGFNYQKSLISLIAILNHDKRDLSIFVETDDDVVVLISGMKIFVQAKSGKDLSIAKLITPQKTSSIIKKNISNGDNNDRFKIAIPNTCFAKSDIEGVNSLILSEGTIFENNVYRYSDEQKNKIINALVKEGVDQNTALSKISNSFIYLSDFDSNQERAIKYLLGEMCEHDIKVDDGAGISILNALFSEIDIRSGRIVGRDAISDKDKELSCDFLNKIFCKGEVFSIETEITNMVAGGNIYLKERIIKERNSGCYEDLESNLRELYGNFGINEDTKNIVLQLVDIAKKEKLNVPEEAIYAITIKIVAEKIINDN